MLVTGVARECCVLATCLCLEGLPNVEEVAVLVEYVRAADSTSEVGDVVWQFLRQDGVTRSESFSLNTWS